MLVDGLKFVGALLSLAALVSAECAAQETSYWTHNGSLMLLEQNAHDWVFKYHQPRAGMIEAGASPGDVVFNGWAEGTIGGTAFIFAGNCGTFPYRVVGTFSDTRVVMTGQAPVISRQTCRITRLRDDTLVFQHVSP